MLVRAVLGEGLGELARLRAKKPQWGKRSSSPSLHHRSGGAMRVCAVLGEGLEELARLRAKKNPVGENAPPRHHCIIAPAGLVHVLTRTWIGCVSLHRVHVHVHVHVPVHG